MMGRTATERVLLVDSAGTLTASVESALAAAGFAIQRAASGAEALDVLRGNAVACIVLEADPASAGVLESVRVCRRLHPATPLLVASDADATDFVVDAIKAGAVDFVVRRDDWEPRLVSKVRAAVLTARERVTARRVVRPSFVGRELEMRALDEELMRAAAGEGRVVLVTGDEGIGKTSLATELLRCARVRGCAAFRGSCPEVGGAPAYWPWVQILRAYGKTASPESLAADVGESAAATWIAPALGIRVPLRVAEPGTLTRFQLVDGVAQLLRRVATRRPLALVLDDLHRADADTMHLFRFVAAECADVPMLLLGAHRDQSEAAPVAEELNRLASLPSATVLRLGRFDAAEVRRYVEQATGARPSPRVVEAIYAKTDGHPLFVAEITRLLATDGRLCDPTLHGEPRLAMPATRRHVIAARVGRLAIECRALLGVAAVIGPEFTCSLLAAIIGIDERLARARLAEAVDDQLVVAGDDEPDVYRFAHVLVRDVVYDALADGARRVVHGRIADALELRAAERWAAFGGEPPLAAIAHHRRESATTREEHQRALHAVVAAGDRAVTLVAYEEAARHYEVALRLAEEHGLVVPTVHQLLVRLAEAYRCAGDAKQARAVGRRALALATGTGDGERIATAALAFAGGLPRFGAFGSAPDVADALRRALATVPSTETALRARLLARLAEELVHGGDAGAPGLARQAIELGRGTGDPDVLAAVLRGLHSALWTPDDIEWRPALAEEIVALAERIGDRVLGLNGQLLRLWSALEHGDGAVAWERLGECRRLASALRLPHFDWVTAAARVCLSTALSRFDEAEALVDEAFARVGRSPTPSMLLVLGVQREHVRFLRGRTDDLDEWRHYVLQHFPSLAAMVECAMVCHDAWRGRDDRARQRLAELMADDFARVHRNGSWSTNMVFLADAAIVLNDRGAARSIHAALTPFAAYNALLAPCYVFAPIAHYLAGLDRVLGDRPGAQRHHEEALRIAERTGARHWVARIQLAFGRFLVESGRAADEARGCEMLASGRALAEALGTRWLLHEADVAARGAVSREAVAERTRFREGAREWEVEYRGARATVPHRTGIAYLRCLLERPGVPVPAIELASLGREGTLVDGAVGRAVDARAQADVRRRLAEIDAEIAACARRNVVPDAALLEERRQCARYVSRHGPELVSTVDRARSGVTKAIARAIAAITRVHPNLGHHLSRHVETGRVCMYVADPGAPIVFEF